MHPRKSITLGLRAALLAALLLPFAACEPARLPARAFIDEPQALAFRCVYPEPPGEAGVTNGLLIGLPVEGCGCTRRDEGGQVVPLGRVECRCSVLTLAGAERHGCDDEVDNDADGKVDADDEQCKADAETGFIVGELGVCDDTGAADEDEDGLANREEPGCYLPGDAFEEQAVDSVRATCKANADGDLDCVPIRSERTGDYLPVFDDTTPENAQMDCEPETVGTVRAYVGASGRGEVAVVDVDEDSEILDVDRSIPGTTSIFVDDLISDIGADPEGRFVFTVNSSSGSLSVVRHDDVSVAYTVELANEALFEVTVFPSPTLPRTLVESESRRLAWLTAPVSGRIYEIDLNSLAAGPSDGARYGAFPDLVRRVIELDAVNGARPRPGRMSVDADGRFLYVTHRDDRGLTVVDLNAPNVQTHVSLVPTRCEDAYLADVQDVNTLCRNGRDDDGDALIDAADPECQTGDAWEGGAASACLQVPECQNAVDDDADGQIDADDADCPMGDERWEGPAPACANLVDDDGDGAIDRGDPDCLNEADDNEAGREVSTCADGLDNDGNGRTDLDDATCQGERCDDGEDNREPSDKEDSASDTEDDDCQSEDARFGLGLPEEGGGYATQAALAGETAEAPGETPCTDGVDDDGDGLTDADDPGCRLFSAARRFAFEALPACGNGLDDDLDGAVDFPADTQCFSASDPNEGGVAAATGTSDVVGARIEVGDGRVRRTAYVLDRATGDVIALDFGDDEAPRGTPTQRILDSGGAIQAMTLRQTADGTALITVDQEGNLSSIELQGPKLVVDREGRTVFARIALDEASEPDQLYVEHFYVVSAGQAWLATGLEAYREETNGRLLTEAQMAAVAAGTIPTMLVLPVPAVVDSMVAVDGKEPAPITVLSGEDDVSPRGVFDPIVAVAGERALLETPTNVRSSAASRTNRLLASPTLYIQDASQIFDPTRHPGFCRAQTDADKAEDGTTPGCIPQGRDARGLAEDPAKSDARTARLVQGSEAVRIVEDSVDAMPADVFSVTYEGVLPGSDSKSGLFGGREAPADGTGRRSANDPWSLLDYDRDFCRVGVEPGDVLVVDNFVGVDKELTDECASLSNRAAAYGDPRRFREPIRYTVQSVTAHRLVLGKLPPADADGQRPAARTTYADQVPLDPRIGLPEVPPAAEAPAARCAAQFIRYKIRAQDDQWLLAGARTGLRHAWINRDGRCEQDPGRVSEGRTGRVTLGVPFENEYFRFTLGFLAQTSADVLGVPDGKRPYALDAHYEFSTVPGRQYNALGGEIGLPRALYWLPVDDRLYVVDTARNTIAEFTGFDPYRSRMRLVRRYD